MKKVLPDSVASSAAYARNKLDTKYEELHLPVAVRLNEGRESGIMGSCWRSPITGVPVLKEATIMADFSIMDLWERSALYGSPEDLVRDPYIFKIKPLALRTWLYHAYFAESRLVAKAPGESAIVQTVLSHKVIDADKPAGRWSPVLCSVPAAFAAVLTADMSTALLCVLMFLFNMAASILMNTPRFFNLQRLITFPPRFVFFILMLWRLSVRGSDGAIVMLSFIVIILLISFDFMVGDFQALYGYGWLCHYEVLKVLPSRIFVCRKHGSAFLPDPEQYRDVSQKVTGMSHFPEMVLIAEIRGLLCQLKPMDVEDWQICWENRTESGRPASFVGLDVYNRGMPSIDALEAGEQASRVTSVGAKETLLATAERGAEPLERREMNEQANQQQGGAGNHRLSQPQLQPNPVLLE